jgi:hypothetical protein
MNSNKQHKKVNLSHNGDCRVIFCPDCGALEIKLDDSTIRTNTESLHVLSSVLNHAKARLAQLQNALPATGNAQPSRIDRVH